jgi:hypothetical protein
MKGSILPALLVVGVGMAVMYRLQPLYGGLTAAPKGSPLTYWPTEHW